MGLDRTFEAMTLKEIAGTSITTSYQALGSALTEPLYVWSIFNSTNQTVYVSENGTDNHYKLLPGSSRTLDLQANKADQRIGAKPTGLQFYVKGILGNLPTVGDVYIEGQQL